MTHNPDDKPWDRLARRVASSHDTHFGHTVLRERLRDLQHQVAELVHAEDAARRLTELGDVGWAVIQLCNELGTSLETVVEATCQRLDQRRARGGHEVALIGTSGNPITWAHLTMGLELLALTQVDEVWYYLAGRHPWSKPLMPGHHRVEMARLATAPYPRLKVCDFDVVHGDRIYAESMETAHILEHHLLPAFPGYRFTWVMGSDVAQSFEQWNGARWMAENLRIVIIHRLGYDFDKPASILADDRHLYLRDGIVTSNISSTLVRERGRASGYDAERVRALVPDAVWQYIVQHKLLEPEAFEV